MSDKTIKQMSIKDLIKAHQSNYAVYHAKSEDEILAAIQNSLKIYPFLTAYYTKEESGLVCNFSNNPIAKKTNQPGTQKPGSLPEEYPNLLSPEIRIDPIENSELPADIKDFLISSGYSTYTILPVKQESTVLGIILVASNPDQILNIDTLDPLIHLAELIPVSIENTRISHTTKQRLRELEAIAQISQAISSSNDLASLYKLLHNQIESTIGDVDFAVALYNKQNETIEIPYASEEGKILSHDPFPIGEGVISILLRTRQPLMLVEDTERRMNALGAKVKGKPAKSWLGCPLVVAGDSIGALVVQDIEHENRFTQDDLRLLIALSTQVAGAIYNIRLLEDARKSALQLQTVAEISREVSGSLIVDSILRQAVTLVQDRFEFYFASIFLVEPGGDNVVIREATGEAGAQMKRAGYKLAVGSKSIIGYVTQQKEPLVVNDVSKDPNYLVNPLLKETMAEACLPLKVGNRILGVIDVQSPIAYVFTNENIRILQILADQLAVAVINSELFAEAQERLSQHRLLHHVTTAAASSTTIEEALKSAVQGLQVTLGGDQISIMMADKDQKMLEVKSSIGYPNEESARLKVPFGVGITGWVASHRQAQRIGDITKDSRYISINPKVRSELAIPLLYRNEILGILNVESTQINAYSENDEEMLGTLAGSLAAIIAHSKLLDQYRQQVERERLLYEITNKIRRTNSPEKILSITLDEISKTLNTRRAHIEIIVKQQEKPDVTVEKNV